MKSAGLNVTWVRCTTTQPCAAPIGLTLALGLCPDRDETPLSAHALAYAMLSDTGRRTACIILPRVQKMLAAVPNGDLATLLGYTMAHELAHLLFQNNDHSGGVMNARWEKPELRAMTQQRLRFSPHQCRQLLSAVRAAQVI